jgi:hypothetical protein
MAGTNSKYTTEEQDKLLDTAEKYLEFLHKS